MFVETFGRLCQTLKRQAQSYRFVPLTLKLSWFFLVFVSRHLAFFPLWTTNLDTLGWTDWRNQKQCKASASSDFVGLLCRGKSLPALHPHFVPRHRREVTSSANKLLINPRCCPWCWSRRRILTMWCRRSWWHVAHCGIPHDVPMISRWCPYFLTVYHILNRRLVFALRIVSYVQAKNGQIYLWLIHSKLD